MRSSEREKRLVSRGIRKEDWMLSHAEEMMVQSLLWALEHFLQQKDEPVSGGFVSRFQVVIQE
uniref:Uncharacterized protein n=1 Tax=viral metagenome TaxID=1070528 RepID=A0A6M3KIN6_9ZZZZ